MSARSALQVTPVTVRLEAALLRLRVAPAQRGYVGAIADLLADARSRAGCEPMVILREGEPVGFYCIETVVRLVTGCALDLPALGLRAFFIAASWQGRGLGTAALHGLLEDLAARHPAARRLVLAVDDGNHAARALYRRAGFVEIDRRYDGRRCGAQRLLWCALPSLHESATRASCTTTSATSSN